MKKKILVLGGFLVIISMILIGVVLGKGFLNSPNHGVSVIDDVTYDDTIYNKLDRSLGANQRTFYQEYKIQRHIY